MDLRAGVDDTSFTLGFFLQTEREGYSNYVPGRSKARRIGGWIGASSVLRLRARCLRGKISQLGLREKYAGGEGVNEM